tara:strand:- start:673 stop:1704 length:1032 start_codon:yes stop_codon:yes gene_type:complete
MTDVVGPRKVIIAGTLVLATGIALLATMEHQWQLFAYYGLASLGFSMSSSVPVSAMVVKWFPERKGLFNGIVFSGVGTGGFVIGFLSGQLITGLGWVITLNLLALWIFLVQLPAVFFGIRNPTVSGTPIPTNKYTSSNLPSSTKDAGLTLKESIKSHEFWIIAILLFSALASSTATFSQIQPFLLDLGYSISTANLFVSINGLAAVISKFAYSFLSDRFSVKKILIYASWTALIGPILMVGVTEYDFPRYLSLVVPVILGSSGTAFSALIAIISAAAFGRKQIGAITGSLGFALLLGMALGPGFVGLLFEITLGYLIPITVLILFNVIFIILLLFFTKMEYRT